RTIAGERPMPMSVALALLVPAALGWWAGRTRTTWHLATAIGGLVLAAISPILTAGLAAPPAWAWILATAGVLGGWQAARQSARTA
ncbi:MAG: hypothetical protein LH624_19415, partial [Cryobacterium sp.]|nr:hypothetical protein [Cryobacterium sp.]